MEQTPNKAPDLLDTTDSLEVIDAISWIKNFLFTLILICLLINGAILCLERLDRINRTDCILCSDSTCKTCNTNPQIPTDTESITAAAQAIGVIPHEAEIQQTPADPNAKTPKPIPAIFNYKPSCQHIAVAIKAVNFVLILTAAAYCLTLLSALMTSLTCRLGGIKHISRAFFTSLIALLLLLPWQTLLPGVMVGAVYTPCEILCQWHQAVQGSKFWMVMWYLRFAGLWILVTMIFIWTHIFRAGKWNKAALRRLGLVR